MISSDLASVYTFKLTMLTPIAQRLTFLITSFDTELVCGVALYANVFEL